MSQPVSSAVPETSSRPEAKPLYLQLQELLVQRVAKGEWGPGQMLPSEMRLAGDYHVHQGTVRKALDAMAARGLVVRQQGKGTFVAASAMRHSPYHFFRMRPLVEGVGNPTTRYVSIAREPASDEERAKLRMSAEWSEVVRITRLRIYGGQPALVEHIAYPADLFPGLDEFLRDLRPDTSYALLEEKYRVLIVRVEERLSAVAASQEDAALLDVAAGTPLLRILRTAFAVDGQPAELRFSVCRTDYGEYVVEHH